MTIEPYLFFNGDCESAVTFYAAALGGTLGPIKRWGDMHVHFTAPGISFMASDGEDLAQDTSRRVVLSLGCDTVEDRDDAPLRDHLDGHGRCFDRLSMTVTVLRQAQHDR